MTKFGDWILAWNPTEPHKLWNVYGDLATLASQLEKALADAASRYHIHARTANVDPPHTGLIKECESPHCIRNCAALAACKEFMEKYSE